MSNGIIKFTDPWDLLTEQAKINNQDQGIEEMLALLESNKDIIDFRHAEVLIGYMELIEKPGVISTFKRVYALCHPFINDVNMRNGLRIAILETMIENQQTTTNEHTN